MKMLLCLLIVIPLWAQEPAPAAGDASSAAKPAVQPDSTATAAQPADASTAAASDQAPAAASSSSAASAQPPAATSAQAPATTTASPAAVEKKPTGDEWFQGSIQFGYRWIPNTNGSFDTYRSVVNLGQGPKLFDADFTLLDPSHRFFDHADIHASSWGDPYNTFRADITKNDAYHLTIDYRNIAYFNFLPSYADPTISQGLLLDQNSFDTRVRTLNALLDVTTKKWITPYFGFSYNEQDGRGITDFHTDENEYPVASISSDQTNTFRAGVRMDLGGFHVTLEEGGTTFREDQGASNSQVNPGNFVGTFLGSALPLKSLSELYQVRGDSLYTKGLLAANPTKWMSVTGQFIYAKPRTNINYTQASSGTFFLQDIFQFYSMGQDVLTGDAQMPHVTGSVTVELRPFRRLRIVEYWMTDRLHNASDALLAENLLLTAATPLSDQQLLSDRLQLNQNREEVDAYYDVTSTLTLRGGYRFEWGDADVRAPLLTGQPLEPANLRRSVGIAGVNYRIGQKFRLTGDAEGSNSDQTFFRTSLQEYEKAHIRARYDVSAQLRIAADFSLLNNSNPSPNIKLDYSAKVESASVYYTPKSVKWANLLLDYSRSAIRSNILYLVPETLSPTPSLYRENGHSLSALASVKWLTFGGTLFISSGSRPTNYYQPLARLTVPVNKHVQWISEWRWYSMSELFYVYENFQSNQFMTSLKLTR